MNKSDKSLHSCTKNQAEYVSISRYLFARRRTHVNAQVINIYFYKSHRVPSSRSNS